MTKKIKKLGYGVGIHFNEFSKLFEVYKLGSFYPGSPASNTSKLVRNKSLKKAVKKFKKDFLK